ncbi:uncharacterized protein TrAFT101_004492 [Trichoderma asperellum]|uniref:Arrestin-like N-terminal domain-containing protein n=1 Tax=Trichoderma asperellum (strain ATCC 204424 / CBS 433.97 / NBRC 101777) TaxID=1042311 RepID=A0A2T3ZMI7_TRIA4|nr:hypothetical protein M441DRAFT_32740 [Trichoderma asperellum CBS 433.97]PTB46027.1 hypothetical protein M441DRAFT_32740 [Trichoderma asperellum CBS 433.97]UKZ88754.1 hypothetical protein TrAFT101_004492 [Trichoderma asperellum]WVH32617.1 hypothetical protein [Trichoderma asperellum]
MKLLLNINRADDTAIRPGDDIQGTLIISGIASQKQPQCTATIGGRLMISVPPQVAGPKIDNAVYTLFEETKQLNYENRSGKNNPDDDVLFMPFNFRFPSHINCSKHPHPCQFPPSTNVHEGNSRIRVEYYITAAVDRHIFGGLSNKKRVAKALQLSSNCSSTTSPASSSIASLPITLRQKDYTERLQPRPDGLPAYTPSIHVQVVHPQPPVFVRGQANPIRFNVHSPSEAIGKIFVRSININFKTSTIAAAGSTAQRVDQDASGVKLPTLIPIDSEILELDTSTWGRLSMLSLRPTFESCLMQIKHTAEISVGISVGPQGSIFHTSSRFDMVVMDPPPSYEEI